jgi:hypothetical protein
MMGNSDHGGSDSGLNASPWTSSSASASTDANAFDIPDAFDRVLKAA